MGAESPPPARQQPTFRSGIDLVAVDVQVVAHDGTPIPSLTPKDFQVTIAGKQRRVVSADFIRSAPIDGTTTIEPTSGPMATNMWQPADAAPSATSRMYMLAFDTDTFDVGKSRDIAAAATGFIRRLQPTDTVGLYTFPVGPRLLPTTDHAAVARAASTIVGQLHSVHSDYHLTPSEIIDITAAMSRARTQNTAQPADGQVLTGDESDVLRRVQIRECGTGGIRCIDEIVTEANSLAFYYEGRAKVSLDGLRELIRILNEQPGRKTVVLFSAGFPVSDRPGGRPDVGDLAKMLGQDAAATNTTIYTLQIDDQPLRSFAAETRTSDLVPVSKSRDNALRGRLLGDFAGASGGALMRVMMGGGEVALERVLRETSSHYLLGVEPGDVDRNGKLRELRVKVDIKNATVRSRNWVVIPKGANNS
jgi:VWFA-related protein